VTSRANQVELRSGRWPRLLLLVLAAALSWAGWRVYLTWWTTDDAFISFRCARNLVEGLGLVFNAGERVEVYTNPLWTLWCAAGLGLGFTAEGWANFWGSAFYIGSILLLALNFRWLTRDMSSTLRWFPLAAVAAALHPEWNIYATSGLETSAFTFLLLAGYMLVIWNGSRTWAVALAGAVFALAGITRHDGVLPAVVVGLFLLVASRKRWIDATVFGLCFAVIWVPFTLWRVSYYGDLFPNTYYAKSADVAWYLQGWLYLRLYLEKYWLVAIGPLLLLAARLLPRRDATDHGTESAPVTARQGVLAGAIALVYVFYVVRVGGDFMFARFLIPATPFLLILLELGWLRAFAARPAWGYGVAGLLLGGMLLSPSPVAGHEFRYGVANEWEYYSPERVADLDHAAEVLAPFFAGLPVRVAFYGDEARVMYKARFEVAIESSAALTERELARKPLNERGRPGHEKYPSAEYLIGERAAHVTFSKVPQQLIRLNQYIPKVTVRFSDDVFGQLLHWDPELMAALHRRGARFDDFNGMLDGYIAQMPSVPPRERSHFFERLERFYFDHVDDPFREATLRGGLPESPETTDSSKRASPESRGKNASWPELPPGRWRRDRSAADADTLTDEQREQIDRLRSIGYVAGSVAAPEAENVIVYDPSRAYQGLNFYTSGHAPEAVLMDMEGAVLHRWRYAFEDAFPDHPLGRDKPDTRFWRRAFLFPNGDVLAIYEGLGIIKLDSRSRLLWARPYPVHHDLHVEPNGTIYVLTREAHLVPRVSNRAPILEDFVSILDPDGVERERVSLLEVFENSTDEHSWIDASRSFWDKERTRGLASDPGDIFHTNSIEVLDGRIETRVPAFRAGNLLLSMCHLDTIAVVDLAQRRVVWSMKGFALQHDPKLTSDGELMVFDNAWNPGRSSVTVLDPATRESVWRYDGSADRPFYSRTCGAAERLPNGNTLITESDGGRAFEVTPEREIVWEFYNPQRAGDDDEYIATLFELVRLPSDFPIDWIADRRRDR
jgi:hypothetical protein